MTHGESGWSRREAPNNCQAHSTLWRYEEEVEESLEFVGLVIEVSGVEEEEVDKKEYKACNSSEYPRSLILLFTSFLGVQPSDGFFISRRINTLSSFSFSFSFFWLLVVEGKGTAMVENEWDLDFGKGEGEIVEGLGREGLVPVEGGGGGNESLGGAQDILCFFGMGPGGLLLIRKSIFPIKSGDIPTSRGKPFIFHNS